MNDTLFEDYQREYGITLDPAQAEACRQVDGKVLLLAVPGSGKTTVMIARLGYLTRAVKIPPSSVLAVTYSVAGAKEMQTRYERIFGQCDVEIRTINGFCAAMIHRYEKVKGRNAFELIDKEGEVTRILKDILIARGTYPTEQELRDLRTAITYCRNSMLNDEEIQGQIKVEGFDFLPIYHAYRDFKREHRLMDYDDQLCYGYKILTSCPEVNAVYADRFRYVCVDEAQDTSKIQHKILEELARRCGNLFMVGDEDQSIYGFRAAYPEALLAFDKTYPDAKILSIGRNYRSTATIVDAAEAFIQQNTERRGTDKQMYTDNPRGEAILHTRLSDLRDLPEQIARRAKKDGNRLAVLFRLNDSMLPMIDYLSDHGIPYRARGMDGLFFSHPIVTDVLAILRFAADPFDPVLFGQLYYKFSCGLRRADYEAAVKYNSEKEMLSYPEYLAQSPYLTEAKRRRVKCLADTLFRINSSDTYEAVRLIFFASGYGSYLAHHSGDTIKRNALLALAYRHRSREAFLARLQALEGAIKRGAVSREGVILSTIHSAKGMEFEKVILCDCKNGILPSLITPANGKQFTPEELKICEEERRLFYVGVTRAKERLELITWHSEFGEDNEVGWNFVDTLLGKQKKEKKLTATQKAKPHREVAEKEMARYYEGVEVHHKMFGDGVVIVRKDNFVQIRFARFPIPKKLDLRTCLEQGLLRES